MISKIATAREADPTPATHKTFGTKGFTYRVTHCTTEHYDPDTGRCLLFGGYASFERCWKCPNLLEHHSEFHDTRPFDRFSYKPLCKTKDCTFSPRRNTCRRCTVRYECIDDNLHLGKTLKLVKLKTRIRYKE